MDKLSVAVLDDYQNVARQFADWDSLKAQVVVFHDAFPDAETVVGKLAEFDVVVAMRERTRFPAEVLRRLKRLKLLITTGPANAAIDVPVAAELGITVCGTDYPFISSTPELTWGLILASLRNIPAETQLVRDGGWQMSVGSDLEGKTLGLLGLGNSGSRVARVGQAFNMETIAWSENLTPEKAAKLGVTAVSKEELFTRSDVLSIHVILSKRTRGLVGARELSSMKPSALLVNTSRGPIVDEDALIHVLRERKIAGAALDVFDIEPLPTGHPLRTLDNVLATPHIGYVTQGMYKTFYEQAVEDIAAFAAGKPIRVIQARA
jgi:phosphoglycerate dehydrogenase-like enzyme